MHLSDKQLFLKHLAPTSPSPLMLPIEHSQGIYLYDTSGKPYIDFISGIGVSVLGHSHPHVVNAVQDQAQKFMHTMVYGEYVLRPQVQFAKLLTDLLPESLNSVYFTNSGTEATEGAMKLAKRYTGRSQFIAMKKAYHGSTQGSASLMYPTDFTEAYQPLLPDIYHMDYNDISQVNQITDQTAAVILETVQAESGLTLPDTSFLKAIRSRCNEVGALLILDEIQCGLGRTGSLWAFTQHDIVPDILLLAKALGGGMPIGAFIASAEAMKTLSFQPILGHITTFGGHPVSCAAGMATVKTIVESQLIESIEKKAKIIQDKLKHPLILSIRQVGLWAAAEFQSFDQLQLIISRCLAKGIITDWFLFNNTSMRIAPPLIISTEQLEKALDVILSCLDDEMADIPIIEQ